MTEPSDPSPAPPTPPPELSIVMPCLNEAETLAACILKAREFLVTHAVAGEIVVADNGSTDGSDRIALDLGARVVRVDRKGYGSALLGGIQAAHGRFVIMGDADQSYNFARLDGFLVALRAGHDLVMGNRFLGGIQPGAMPPLHRWLGNPVLTGIGRLFFRSPSGDFHCGLRGFRREAILGLDLQTTGMEFASEMVVKATLSNLKITEVPTTLAPDGRSRPPHLRSWRDGWRHLRFMLLFSPRWLFLYPGLAVMLAGLLAGLWLIPGPRQIGTVTFDIHTLLYAGLAVLLGFQAVLFALFSHLFAVTEGFLPPNPRFRRTPRWLTLETGLVAGALLIAIGFLATLAAVFGWSRTHFGPLDPSQTLRTVIPAVTAMALGGQIILASFFLSVLGLSRRRNPTA